MPASFARDISFFILLHAKGAEICRVPFGSEILVVSTPVPAHTSGDEGSRILNLREGKRWIEFKVRPLHRFDDAC